MEHYQKKFIELALQYQALRFGEFKLKSGRMSPYFFNMGQFNDGIALACLGECYAAAIHQSDIPFDLLFGPAYKGIPLVCTSSIALSTHFKRNVPYCFNRKEAKDHGEGGITIGAPITGRVMIIDDVITAGTAIRGSFQLLNSFSVQIAGVIVALDRQEKGESELSALQEIQQQYNIPVRSIINFTHIIEYVSKQADFAAFRDPLLAYRKRYGIHL